MTSILPKRGVTHTLVSEFLVSSVPMLINLYCVKIIYTCIYTYVLVCIMNVIKLCVKWFQSSLINQTRNLFLHGSGAETSSKVTACIRTCIIACSAAIIIIVVVR